MVVSSGPDTRSLYRATIPLAIGALVGDQLNAGLWAVVALLTRGQV